MKKVMECQGIALTTGPKSCQNPLASWANDSQIHICCCLVTCREPCIETVPRNPTYGAVGGMFDSIEVARTKTLRIQK